MAQPSRSLGPGRVGDPNQTPVRADQTLRAHAGGEGGFCSGRLLSQIGIAEEMPN